MTTGTCGHTVATGDEWEASSRKSSSRDGGQARSYERVCRACAARGRVERAVFSTEARATAWRTRAAVADRERDDA
jgi:hypothetical protein